MADGVVQVAPDASGKKIDTSELTRADASLVERQRVVLGDDSSTSAGGLAETSDKKLQVGSLELRMLHSIDDTLKQIAFLLEAALN
jgi:hypothetical protein